MKTMALMLVAILTGCDAEPATTTRAEPRLDATGLDAHSLGASSLPQMRLLATPDGREVVSQVVSCALARGATITTITGDGTPYSFAGSAGLAPHWAERAPTAVERRRVSDCVRAHKPGVTPA